jgi:hypothetical protein
MITRVQYIFTRHKVYTCIAGGDNIHILEDFGNRGLGLAFKITPLVIVVLRKRDTTRDLLFAILLVS